MCRFRIDAVPGSDVVIPRGRHQDGSHNGADVEVGPCEHLLHNGVNGELVAVLSHSLLHGDSSLVVDWLSVVSVVVGLHEEPGVLIEGVVGVGAFGVSLDDHAFVGSNSSNDVVDGR